MTADDIKQLLRLEPLPEEGGFFRETYRSTVDIPAGVLHDAYDSPRSAGTSIYYLIESGVVSAMHRLPSHEVFHWYAGVPVRQLHLRPDGSGEEVAIGVDLARGERPQVTVPGGVWQGARLAEGGAWALMGCTVTPGFDYADYEHGERGPLLERWPAWAEAIRALTPDG